MTTKNSIEISNLLTSIDTLANLAKPYDHVITESIHLLTATISAILTYENELKFD